VDIDVSSIQIEDWVIRYRLPDGIGPYPVIWLFHGWTGDENSMSIFTSRIPHKYLLLAPRGLYTTPMGGYGWHPMDEGRIWPQVEDFGPVVNKLTLLMENWPTAAPSADFSRFRAAGFSQGGALAYTFAILHPDRIIALAGLASFLPDGAGKYLQETNLKDLPVFVSHGIKDNLVPIARARQTVQLLDQAGAQVTYCESDVGHKLSVDCFKGMGVFF